MGWAHRGSEPSDCWLHLDVSNWFCAWGRFTAGAARGKVATTETPQVQLSVLCVAASTMHLGVVLEGGGLFMTSGCKALSRRAIIASRSQHASTDKGFPPPSRTMWWFVCWETDLIAGARSHRFFTTGPPDQVTSNPHSCDQSAHPHSTEAYKNYSSAPQMFTHSTPTTQTHEPRCVPPH